LEQKTITASPQRPNSQLVRREVAYFLAAASFALSCCANNLSLQT